MKQLKRFPFFILILLAALLLTGCAGVSLDSQGLVVGDTYRLESGQTLNTDLTVVGGSAFLAEGSTVNGDVAVLGGNVTANGQINGDMSIIGGNAHLGESARVRGELVTVGGTVNRSAGAVVEGMSGNNRSNRVPMMRTLPIQLDFDPIFGPLMAVFRALAVAALAIVVHLFAATQLERTGQAALAQPVITGGVGVLTVIVAPALLLLLAITIILLPLSLLGVIILGIAGLFGWIALGLVVGRQIAAWLKQPWSDTISAGVGTLVLSLLSSMLSLVWCIGWLANFLVSMIALGAVFLTRFGTQAYPPYYTGGLVPQPPYNPPPSAPPPAPPVPYADPGARVYRADEPGPGSDPRGDNI